ncbi:MAG: carboxylating nicotinate-nucleotide diphosphorylase [Deltaproteobacteria bacterium]|nr:carboxylating nicotinate-nucleotide diphosphorylase [Deltaproteobacteria bacterium]
MEMNSPNATELIHVALAEDIGGGDITTLATIPAASRAEGRIVAKATGVLSGLEVAQAVFHAVDATLHWRGMRHDGDAIVAGDTLATLHGRTRSILSAERTALNFLQRLSGIASLTRRFVDAVAGTPAKILDTRKTTPGWRELEKYAVVCGGGGNHRHGLYDRYLIKSNHTNLCGGLQAALACVEQQRVAGFLVEVEVRTLDELRTVLPHAVDIVMLDNCSPETVAQAVALAAGRVQLEVSGGITLDNIRAYAATGVDFISIGALTHSAPALDLHLVVE